MGSGTGYRARSSRGNSAFISRAVSSPAARPRSQNSNWSASARRRRIAAPPVLTDIFSGGALIQTQKDHIQCPHPIASTCSISSAILDNRRPQVPFGHTEGFKKAGREASDSQAAYFRPPHSKEPTTRHLGRLREAARRALMRGWLRNITLPRCPAATAKPSRKSFRSRGR